MDRLDRYRVFLRLVETGSFTRSADSLGLPRSTVSAAIQELEKQVGARLLHRTTRRVTPTEDGLSFYARCQTMLVEAEAVENMFRLQQGGPSGTVRIDVPGRIGRLLIAPALPDFLARFPDIDVVLGTTDRAVNLVEEGMDCALRVGNLPDSRLIGRKLGDIALINVAAPSYLAAHGTPLTPEDLPSHIAVGYASPSTGRLEDWEWMQDGVLTRLPMRSRVTVNNAEAYIACALAGMGLIQIPAYDVAGHFERGELVEVMPEHRAQSMPLTLLYPHKHITPQVQVFCDWLTELLQGRL